MPVPTLVMPAKAGIQYHEDLGPRLRGDDDKVYRRGIRLVMPAKPGTQYKRTLGLRFRGDDG